MDMHTFKSMLKLFAGLWMALPVAMVGQVFQEGPVDTDQAIAELVSDVAVIRPGQTFEVALRVKLDPHWHVYWKNPGDAGLAPKIEWELPDGFVAGELEFPVPERIVTPPDYVSYGYEGEVFFLTQVTAPANLAVGQTLALNAKANWLVCESMCIPGNADLSLKLPVTETGESLVPSPWADALATARKELPRLLEEASVSFEVLAKTVTASIDWAGFEGIETEGLYFYVEAEGLVNSAAKQNFALSGSSLIVSMEKSEWFEGEVDQLKGILVNASGFAAAGGVQAVALDSAKEGIATIIDRGQSLTVFDDPQSGFLRAMLFAFAGGLILNLMPCVFPVLSIKILGFVNQSGEDKGKALKHGLVFAGGVLVSFWLLGGLLLVLRSFGEKLGWGFQMQNPYFVASMLILIFGFGLSMAGLFEFGTSAIGLGGKVKQEGYGGSFGSGALATILATPCTAPLMANAIPYALDANTSVAQALLVFTSLAAGMAVPYVVLSANPRLIDKLPRPGPWMETFKQIMAFLMFATCVWLISVMLALLDTEDSISVLGGLVFISIAAWVYGKWATLVKSRATVLRARFATVLFFALGAYWLMPSADRIENLQKMEIAKIEARDRNLVNIPNGSVDKFGVEWVEFSPKLIELLESKGRPYYIDFTAEWCLICKSNKGLVFSSDEVKSRIEEKKIVMVKADWTRSNPIITEVLESYGRAGVPLNVYHSGESGMVPVVLPQNLTPGIVLDAIESGI